MRHSCHPGRILALLGVLMVVLSALPALTWRQTLVLAASIGIFVLILAVYTHQPRIIFLRNQVKNERGRRPT